MLCSLIFINLKTLEGGGQICIVDFSYKTGTFFSLLYLNVCNSSKNEGLSNIKL